LLPADASCLAPPSAGWPAALASWLLLLLLQWLCLRTLLICCCCCCGSGSSCNGRLAALAGWFAAAARVLLHCQPRLIIITLHSNCPSFACTDRCLLYVSWRLLLLLLCLVLLAGSHCGGGCCHGLLLAADRARSPKQLQAALHLLLLAACELYSSQVPFPSQSRLLLHLLWLRHNAVQLLLLMRKRTAVYLTLTVQQHNLLQLLLPSCIGLAGSIQPRS
jgi:hypothetical protein